MPDSKAISAGPAIHGEAGFVSGLLNLATLFRGVLRGFLDG
ncbi:MAG TPA: hypothetical protein VL393_06910 [Candidatus Binataceae bacterium]|jgi:hypothetical protein|nr:hypothetical protein [Candidatus Binataceae bacterium]